MLVVLQPSIGFTFTALGQPVCSWLAESAVFAWLVRALHRESCKTATDGFLDRDAASGADGYEGVPCLHLRRQDVATARGRRNSIPTRSFKVWQRKKWCTVSLNDRNFQTGRRIERWYTSRMIHTILQGDVRDQLRTLSAGSARTCVTSPPYWGLRDYGVSGQLGLEPTPDAYVAAMVEVFRDVRRVLAGDGTLWLNLGDSYCGGGRGCEGKGWEDGEKKNKIAPIETPLGMKAKDLVGIPWMVAFALRADGWYLRSDIIWSKPNPMPESVTDRPTKAHEYIFLLSKSAKYYYDAKAIREPDSGVPSGNGFRGRQAGSATYHAGSGGGGSAKRFVPGSGRNKRSVWHITLRPFKGAHFATFPPTLIEPCILAGSAPGDTVLDPFLGSGTTLAVAKQHGRNGIGCELNPEYVALAQQRIDAVAIPLS